MEDFNEHDIKPRTEENEGILVQSSQDLDLFDRHWGNNYVFCQEVNGKPKVVIGPHCNLYFLPKLTSFRVLGTRGIGHDHRHNVLSGGIVYRGQEVRAGRVHRDTGTDRVHSIFFDSFGQSRICKSTQKTHIPRLQR